MTLLAHAARALDRGENDLASGLVRNREPGREPLVGAVRFARNVVVPRAEDFT